MSTEGYFLCFVGTFYKKYKKLKILISLVNRKELNKKYGKKLIDKIFKEGYLDGCTSGVNDDGTLDIYEIDIINAVKEMKRIPYAWD